MDMCDKCPLKGKKVIYAEPTQGPLAIVGEAPGYQEVKAGKYFIGESGKRLQAGFDYFGIDRERVHINNALRCRPPQNMGEKDWNLAISCCKERLLQELRESGCKMVLTCGKRAFQALTEKKAAILGKQPWIGGYLSDNASGVPMIPTVHPAHCLRGGSEYWPVFYAHLERSWRIATGVERPFAWPHLYYYGSNPEETLLALTHIAEAPSGTCVGFDIETAGYDSVRDPFTAIGVATRDVSVSIAWPPERHFGGSESWRSLLGNIAHFQIKGILSRSDLPKVAQNGGYDVLGLEAKGFEVNGYAHDTLLMHHTIAPFMLHNLGFISQLEFAVDPWKAMFRGFDKATLEELTLYNAKDTAILPRLVKNFEPALAATHRGAELYAGYMSRSKIAMQMQRRGIRVDPGAIETHKETVDWTHAAQSEELHELIDPLWDGGPKKKNKTINIDSDAQLKHLFYKILGVPVTKRTETGAPSLDKEMLVDLSTMEDPLVSELARKLRPYRKNRDLRNKVLNKLTWDKDSRVYPVPKIYGARTGRWSYEGIIQTVTPMLRNIFCASPPDGWILEADYSQLELRIIAILSGDKQLLEWYAAGVDVHSMNTQDLFGMYDKNLRRMAKIFVFQLNYSEGKNYIDIWKKMSANFPDLTIETVKKLIELWFVKHSAIKQYRSELLKIAEKKDYVECPISGRRHYFFGDVEPNKVYNHPIQGSGADIIDGAIPKIFEDIKRLKDTHLILQVHDALILDTQDPIAAAAVLQEHMCAPVEIGGARHTFPIDFKLGRNWGAKSDTNPHGQVEFGSVEEIETYING